MESQNKFWAIIELFGHSIIAGEVSKCEIGDFIQVNIPQVGVVPAWSKMLNPKAVYAITPVTEDVARQKAEALKAMPIDKWDTEQLLKNRFSEMEEQGKIKRLEPVEVEEDDFDDDHDDPEEWKDEDLPFD